MKPITSEELVSCLRAVGIAADITGSSSCQGGSINDVRRLSLSDGQSLIAKVTVLEQPSRTDKR